jgi:hypothetical protein
VPGRNDTRDESRLLLVERSQNSFVAGHLDDVRQPSAVKLPGERLPQAQSGGLGLHEVHREQASQDIDLLGALKERAVPDACKRGRGGVLDLLPEVLDDVRVVAVDVPRDETLGPR